MDVFAFKRPQTEELPSLLDTFQQLADCASLKTSKDVEYIFHNRVDLETLLTVLHFSPSGNSKENAASVSLLHMWQMLKCRFSKSFKVFNTFLM